MAGYFEYLGKVFTEKGSWYKILTIVVLQGLSALFAPKAMMNNMSPNSVPEFNVPGIILYLLCTTLFFGYVIQIYNGAMNNKAKLLPDIDFFDMFVKSVRLVPFCLVWIIYFAVIGICVVFTMPSLARSSHLAAVLSIVIFIAFWLFMAMMFAAMLIIHSKSFSYRYVLNPLTPFKICPMFIGPVLLLTLLYGLLNAVLYGLLVGSAALLGASGGGDKALLSMIALGVLITIWLYIYDVFSFAYNLKFADIIKEKLCDTEYLDDEFAPAVINDEEDDEDDFSGYAHNSDDEE